MLETEVLGFSEYSMSAHKHAHEELFELAQLELIGALDPIELARFDKLMRESSPALAEEVRVAQAILAADETLLPGVTPDPSLKFRVMAAVGEEIAARDARLAPLASIGGSVAVGRAGRRSDADRDEMPASVYAFESKRDAVRWRRSSALWRAASFVLTGGLVTSLYFYSQISGESTKLFTALHSESVQREVNARAPGFELTMLDRPRVVGLSATAAGGNAAVILLVDTLKGRLLAMGVGGIDGNEYEFYSLDASKTRHLLGSLTIRGTVTSVSFDIGGLPAGALNSFEIVDRMGEVLFTSS